MRQVSRHFPPVVHKWSCSEEEAAVLVPAALVKPQGLSVDRSLIPTSKVFKHELLQSFSFHLFAKRPIEPITTERSLYRDLLRRITLSALQIRLNVQQRQDPLFTFIDFNQLNWPREGCAVCSLDMTTDINKWRPAVVMAVQEIRRLGLHGLTKSELQRYKLATISEAAQAAAQMDQMGNEDVLTELMETEACGHTYMHPARKFEIISQLLEDISLEDINGIAKELCEHLSHISLEQGVTPAAVIACAPYFSRSGETFTLSEADIASAVEEAMVHPLEPLEDTVVPDTLLTMEQLQEKARANPPQFVPLQGSCSSCSSSSLQSLFVNKDDPPSSLLLP